MQIGRRGDEGVEGVRAKESEREQRKVFGSCGVSGSELRRGTQGVRAEMRAKRQFEWVARRRREGREGPTEESEDRTALQMERATVAENGRESRNCPGDGERKGESKTEVAFFANDAVTTRQNGEKACSRFEIPSHMKRTTLHMSG